MFVCSYFVFIRLVHRELVGAGKSNQGTGSENTGRGVALRDSYTYVGFFIFIYLKSVLRFDLMSCDDLCGLVISNGWTGKLHREY